ncbi:hypothetical protein ACFQZZ_14170 [Nocardia sp. GCM10030253]|uniref:hypothetical protein n=1 Tax=Nocardia sp. GCM10030253 TaxID=3273404 RepID=UPI00362D0CF7
MVLPGDGAPLVGICAALVGICAALVGICGALVGICAVLVGICAVLVRGGESSGAWLPTHAATTDTTIAARKPGKSILDERRLMAIPLIERRPRLVGAAHPSAEFTLIGPPVMDVKITRKSLVAGEFFTF